MQSTPCPGELWGTFGFGSATFPHPFGKLSTRHCWVCSLLFPSCISWKLLMECWDSWAKKSKWMILLNLFCICQAENLGAFWWVAYAAPGSLADEFLIEDLLEFEFTGHYEEKILSYYLFPCMMMQYIKLSLAELLNKFHYPFWKLCVVLH